MMFFHHPFNQDRALTKTELVRLETVSTGDPDMRFFFNNSF